MEDDLFELNGAATQAPKLNLSHIECTDQGVQVHFVLLFAGKQTPGNLTGTWSGGDLFAQPGKSTGNVWHYEVYLPEGEIEILDASVTTGGGTTVTLHNPSEYTGNYECSDEQVCDVEVEAQDVYCTDQPLGDPASECAEFGLAPVGKDDGVNTGLSFNATMDAYVAIVKAGNHGCGPGQHAYRIVVGVSDGQTLFSPNDQAISHVTYCDCAIAAE